MCFGWPQLVSSSGTGPINMYEAYHFMATFILSSLIIRHIFFSPKEWKADSVEEVTASSDSIVHVPPVATRRAGIGRHGLQIELKRRLFILNTPACITLVLSCLWLSEKIGCSQRQSGISASGTKRPKSIKSTAKPIYFSVLFENTRTSDNSGWFHTNSQESQTMPFFNTLLKRFYATIIIYPRSLWCKSLKKIIKKSHRFAFSRLARPLQHQRTLINWGDANSQ